MSETKQAQRRLSNDLQIAKAENLEVELDESKLWWSIKRVAAATGEDWREYNWKALKSASFSLGLPPRKIFDANFGALIFITLMSLSGFTLGLRHI